MSLHVDLLADVIALAPENPPCPDVNGIDLPLLQGNSI